MAMAMAQHAVILITMSFTLSFAHINMGPRQILSDYDSGRVLRESNSITELRQRLDAETVRIDPSNHFKKYRGGYDIRNNHYWMSAAFTGIPGYAIAVIWLICGVIFLVITTTCCKLTKKTVPSLSLKAAFLQPIILFTLLLTLLAVIACGLILGGGTGFHSRTMKITGVITHAAENAAETLRSTTGAMKSVNTNLTRAVDASDEAVKFLTSTSKSLDDKAATIESQAFENRHLIHDGLDLLFTLTEVMTALNLVFVIALLACSVMSFHRTLQVLAVFCWIFTSFSWFAFGLYYSLQSFATDTCTAIKGFQMDPYNNSFSPVLPCDELINAQSVLIEVGAGIYNLVDKVNTNITTSFGDIVQICNPFSIPPLYAYQPWKCSSTSKKIGDVPKVLRQLVCPDNTSEGCNGGITIPASFFNKVEAYCTLLQMLVDGYPGIEKLVQCQQVKDAFSEIHHKHCRALRKYLLIMWLSLVLLSLVLVGLILIWIFGAHQWQNRGNVKPNRYDDPEQSS